MAYCYGRDFLFCDVCGAQLRLNSTKYAECPLCNFRRPAKNLIGREIRYTITAEFNQSFFRAFDPSHWPNSIAYDKHGHYPAATFRDIRRELKIEPFVRLTTVSMGAEQPQQKKVTNTPCPMCRHPKLEYYSRQMRSADEGETVFYECPNCNHKFTENN